MLLIGELQLTSNHCANGLLWADDPIPSSVVGAAPVGGALGFPFSNWQGSKTMRTAILSGLVFLTSLGGILLTENSAQAQLLGWRRRNNMNYSNSGYYNPGYTNTSASGYLNAGANPNIMAGANPITTAGASSNIGVGANPSLNQNAGANPNLNAGVNPNTNLNASGSLGAGTYPRYGNYQTYLDPGTKRYYVQDNTGAYFYFNTATNTWVRWE
jgi:hypothetical protein